MLSKELSKAEKAYRGIRLFRAVSIPLMIALVVFAVVFTYLKVVNERESVYLFSLLIIIPVSIAIPVISSLHSKKFMALCKALEADALKDLDLNNWMFVEKHDVLVKVKSKNAVDNYSDIKFFKENPDKLSEAEEIISLKEQYSVLLNSFLDKNELSDVMLYNYLETRIINNLRNTKDKTYNIGVEYLSPAGRKYEYRVIPISIRRIEQFKSEKSLLMTKGEYNKYLKDQERNVLDQKHHIYYEKVNDIIDKANDNKEKLVISEDKEKLDKLVASLFDRTINSIKKIKSTSSEEWNILDQFINSISDDINTIIARNSQITEYYTSSDFLKLKETCNNLMSSQMEFNEYIDEKVKSISDLFGTNVMRNETTNEDIYAYIHPYKKSITPFTAEVSSNVFASAENNPLEYVIKYFYPDKANYPNQIRKLQLLIEELETLKDAKSIIENYKNDIKKYLEEVPDFVLDNDESGFYSHLGFATINEKALTVEYRFAYTSNGGNAQRSFTIPMTEETIVKLIQMLESKLTFSAFTKEQRSLMTSKLRQQIKERDNYTCKICGNSTHVEPNLLLEIDHIIPVAKGGCTEENNLQTLCWKCNRQKGSKISD